jgi:hypothetical protein
MPREDDLRMSSTTDSAEQIREGLGLPPAEPVDPVAAAQAQLDKATADAAAARATEEAEEVSAEAAEGAAEVVAAPAPRKHRSKAELRIDALTREKNEALAKASVAETEGAALRRRLDELAATTSRLEAALPKPKPAEVTSPRLTELEAERKALTRPTPQQFYDDPNPDAYEEARETYLLARATLDAEERIERRTLAAAPPRVTETATRVPPEVLAAHEARGVAARARHADWDAVVTEDVKFRQGGIFQALINDVSYEHAAEFMYWMGTHRADVARLDALDTAAFRANRFPAAVVEEIGAIKYQIAAELAGPPAGRHTGATQDGAVRAVPPAPKPRSQAPPPPEATLGNNSGQIAASIEDRSERELQTMSHAEYMRLRDRETRTRR